MSAQVGFIIIGAQKAGTTALYDYLRDVPDVALSTTKEVHFFDDETRDWDRPDYSDYHAAFAPDDGRLRGEATPIYVYWPQALERIRRYNPAARLILLLRDPVERAWSHWRMETSRGVERAGFSWCVAEGRQRLFEAEPWGHHREFSYVERGFYGAQAERLFGLFPRDQVLILKAEDLRADPRPHLDAVCDFLGVARAPDLGRREIHIGQDMGQPEAADVERLRGVYRRDQIRLRALTGIGY